MFISPCSESLSRSLAQKLDERPEIRPLPAVVPKLLVALQDTSSPIGLIASIIESDPALAVRLLRIANSPLYGIRTEIRSIEHACSLLGMRALKSLALSVAGAGMFSRGSTASKERTALWEHSLGCATIAKLLAESIPSVTKDDAFLAGIFHDVGKLLFLDVIPEEYARLTDSYLGRELADHEQSHFELTHEQIGLRWAHAWNLPEGIKMAIGFHHQPAESPNHADLVNAIHIADGLARSYGVGSPSTVDVTLARETKERYGLDAAAVENLQRDAHVLYKETKLACQ